MVAPVSGFERPVKVPILLQESYYFLFHNFSGNTMSTFEVTVSVKFRKKTSSRDWTPEIESLESTLSVTPENKVCRVGK